MARPKVQTKAIKVTLTGQLAELVERIAELGIHGATPAEVGRTFIANEVERLVVKEGMLRTPLFASEKQK